MVQFLSSETRGNGEILTKIREFQALDDYGFYNFWIFQGIDKEIDILTKFTISVGHDEDQGLS